MADKPTVSAEAKPRSSREDVLDFLDSLDSYSTPEAKASATSTSNSSDLAAPVPTGLPSVTPNSEDAQSVLDFLDEITQRSSAPTPPINPLTRRESRTNVLSATSATPRRSGESSRSVVTPKLEAATLPDSTTSKSAAPAVVEAEGGWGWSSVWSQATNVVQQASQIAQQARTAAEEQVKAAQTNAAGLGGIGGLSEGFMKALGENEQAKKWSEGVMEYAKGAHLDQIGKDIKSTTLRSLTDLLNAVAPPIAEHEVIQVSLSHDMIGYDGVETLVYRGLAKIMDQIEGGTLIVNKGNESKPKDSTPVDSDERQLNAVEGLAEGWKLAEANLDDLVKNTFKPEVPSESPEAPSITVPVTNCPIFLRIQPCLAPLPFYTPSNIPTIVEPVDTNTTATSTSPISIGLFFLLILRDPTHNLVHSSISQSIPGAWLDIPFEENEWVEDVMVDVLRTSVQTIGQEYITQRTTGRAKAINKARAEALSQLTPDQKVNIESEAKAAEMEKERQAAEAVASSRVL